MVMNTTTNYGMPAPAAGTPAADYDTEFATAATAADTELRAQMDQRPIVIEVASGASLPARPSNAGSSKVFWLLHDKPAAGDYESNGGPIKDTVGQADVIYNISGVAWV